LTFIVVFDIIVLYGKALMKNLALAFCSLRPVQLSEQVNDAREKEYLISLSQLKRVLPNSFDMVICENTIDNPQQIKNDDLRTFFENSEMCSLGSEGNIGTKNKGMGELLMLKTALEQTDLDNYENIAYVTGRHFFTCPYVFEKIENLEKQALVSNPDFYFLNGNFIGSHKEGLYNDMFFSMKSSVMLGYADYAMSNLNSAISQHTSSEQLLFNYINQNDIEYEWLDWLGLVRNAWDITGNIVDINNLHIC